MKSIIPVVFSLLFLVSCGSKTTVVLLPEADGTTGSIVVRNKAESTTLDKPYTYTQVRDDTSALPEKTITPEKVAGRYRDLMAAEPLKPASFILYFEYNSTSLTQESDALIPDIVRTAKAREPCEISVIGHSDSKGAAEYNYRLALERATAVADILKQTDLSMKEISIRSHGENDPLVPTTDNASEIKNRRVEIMIR